MNEFWEVKCRINKSMTFFAEFLSFGNDHKIMGFKFKSKVILVKSEMLLDLFLLATKKVSQHFF